MLDHTDLKSMLSDPDLLRDRAFVAGSWVAAESGGSFGVTNPARGDTICSVPDLVGGRDRAGDRRRRRGAEALGGAHRQGPRGGAAQVA